MPTAFTHTRRLLLAALASLALSLAFAPTASAAGCDNAEAEPGEVSTKALVSATVCLINAERSRHGLRRLRLNARLSKAARRHAEDMVRGGYFSHDSQSGASFIDRIRLTGYLRSAASWLVGENLAWGTESRSTPRWAMEAWMTSPPHRKNILTARFREIGIGIALGAPVRASGAAATYATEFGTRRR